MQDFFLLLLLVGYGQRLKQFLGSLCCPIKKLFFSYLVLCIEVDPFTDSCGPRLNYMYMRRGNTVAVKTNAFM